MDEKIERDPELSALLRGVSGEAPVDEVSWDALRRRIQAGTASVIEAKRAGRRWMRAFMGTAMAASVALLFMVSRWNEVGNSGAFAGNDATIEEILGSDASDEEFRALLAGSGNVEELLLLAASDNES